MKKLSKILSVIEKFLKKSKSKDWMTEDNSEYLAIVDNYSKQIGELWKNTGEKLAKKIKQKGLELDEEALAYEGQELLQTTYVNEALKILGFAFGEAVVLGYNEIISRGITVDIPDNPFNLFSEAGEIHNYVHSALSYEQQQMNEIYNSFNNSENAKQKIRDWFAANQYRVEDLMISGLVWYGINYGFARATLQTQGNEGLLIYWLTETDKNVCKDCLDLEAGNPYGPDNPLKTLPGGGKTVCGSSCRCLIDTNTREQ